MIREELDDNNNPDLQGPVKNLFGQAPGGPVYSQSNTSLRQVQDENEHPRSSSGKK
jgi:hypothetical protein